MKHISMRVASVLLGLMRKNGSMRSCFNKRQTLNINFHHAAMYQNHNDGQIGLCEENMKREREPNEDGKWSHLPFSLWFP